MKDLFDMLKELMPVWLTFIVLAFGYLIFLYYKISKQTNSLAEKQSEYFKEKLDTVEKIMGMFEKTVNHQNSDLTRLYGLNEGLKDQLEKQKNIELTKLDIQLKDISDALHLIKSSQEDKSEFEKIKDEIGKAKNYTEIKYNTLIQNIQIGDETGNAVEKVNQVFLILPSSSDSELKYEMLKAICKVHKLNLVRTEGMILAGESITEKVKMLIRKSDFVIADVGGNNANAMYELGFAHALNKPVVLLASKLEDVKLDISNYRVILYDKFEDAKDKLSQGFTETMEEIQRHNDLKKLIKLNKNLQTESSISDYIELSRKVMQTK